MWHVYGTLHQVHVHVHVEHVDTTTSANSLQTFNATTLTHHITTNIDKTASNKRKWATPSPVESLYINPTCKGARGLQNHVPAAKMYRLLRAPMATRFLKGWWQ